MQMDTHTTWILGAALLGSITVSAIQGSGSPENASTTPVATKAKSANGDKQAAQGVLGACGTDTQDQAVAKTAVAPGQMVQSVPLPGQRATNFALPAVVGDEIKTVKLSDSNGKWRVLCFFPAAFTFV